MLRTITNTPWYVTNEILHRDLDVPTVREEIGLRVRSYKERISNHPNILAKHLMTRRNLLRRLKRRTPSDLLTN